MAAPQKQRLFTAEEYLARERAAERAAGCELKLDEVYDRAEFPLRRPENPNLISQPKNDRIYADL